MALHPGAPLTREEMLRDYPDVEKLRAGMRRAFEFDIIDGYFEWYKRTASVPKAVREITLDPANEEVFARVEQFARLKRLREDYKLEPERMIAIVDGYGPFDWRSAYPHAIYWAELGLERLDELEVRVLGALDRHGIEAREQPSDGHGHSHGDEPQDEPARPGEGQSIEEIRADEGLYEFERVTLERVIYASMQSQVRRGRMLFDTKGEWVMEVGTDYRFADATLPLFEKVIEAHGQRYQMGTSDGLRNFLGRGIIEFYAMGEPAKSVDYYNRLKERFPSEVGDQSFDEYRRDRLLHATVDMTTNEMRVFVTGLLRQAYTALGCNQDETAVLKETQAKIIAAKWNLDTEPNLRATVRYDVIREAVLTDILAGRYRMHPRVLANLKTRLREEKGDTVVARIMASLDAHEAGMPAGEQVGDEWQIETY